MNPILAMNGEQPEKIVRLEKIAEIWAILNGVYGNFPADMRSKAAKAFRELTPALEDYLIMSASRSCYETLEDPGYRDTEALEYAKVNYKRIHEYILKTNGLDELLQDIEDTLNRTDLRPDSIIFFVNGKLRVVLDNTWDDKALTDIRLAMNALSNADYSDVAVIQYVKSKVLAIRNLLRSDEDNVECNLYKILIIKDIFSAPTETAAQKRKWLLDVVTALLDPNTLVDKSVEVVLASKQLLQEMQNVLKDNSASLSQAEEIYRKVTVSYNHD